MKLGRVMTTGAAALGLFGLWIPACGSSSNEGPSDAGADREVTVSDTRPSSKTSTIAADPGTLVADGTTTTKLTVVARTEAGAVIPNAHVVLTSSSKGAKFSAPNIVTDQQGVFTATMASTTAALQTVNAAFDNGTTISVQVNFQLCHGPLFLPAAPVLLGKYRSGYLTTGDFNADGNLDIAIAGGDTSMTVLLGKGDGSFSLDSNTFLGSVGNYPASISAGDVNGDKKLDLAIGLGSNEVAILLGDGAGKFDLQEYDANTNLRAVYDATMGDFNGDKKLDLAAASADGLSILLGTGDGHFSKSGTTAIQSQYRIVAADVDKDGKLDAAVLSLGSAPLVTVEYGNGNGTFSAPANASVGKFPSSFVLADFDGNGQLDVAVADEGDNDVAVSLGQFSRAYSAVNSRYGVGASPEDIKTGDYNDDGQVDLAVVNKGTNNVSILLGRGNGTFAAALNYSTGPGPSEIASGDFDGDGKVDLAVSSGNSIGILLRSGCIMSAY